RVEQGVLTPCRNPCQTPARYPAGGSEAHQRRAGPGGLNNMKARAFLAAPVAAVMLVPGIAANATITGTSGQVTKISPPACVDTGCGISSNTTSFAWDAQQGVTLASPLPVNINAVGS